MQCNIDVEIHDSEIITLVEENFTFIDPDTYEEVIDGLTEKIEELEQIVVALQLATGVDIDQSKNYIHSVVNELVDNCDLMLQVTNPS